MLDNKFITVMMELHEVDAVEKIFKIEVEIHKTLTTIEYFLTMCIM